MLLVLLLYAGLLTAVGLGRKHLTDADGFFLASRRLGTLWISITLTASWIGAASTLVTLQRAATGGHAAMWVMAVPTILTLLTFLALTGVIRNRGFTTLPNLLKKVYGQKVTHIAAGLILIYMVLLTASQLVAWGKLLDGAGFLPYHFAVLSGAGLVCLYSLAGGFFSVVRTDGIQLVFLSASITVIYFIIGRGAGEPLSRGVNRFLHGAGEHSLLVLSFTLAWVISPVVWQRVAAARSSGSARRGILLAAAAILVFYLMVIPSGMSIGSVSPDITSLLTRLAQMLPGWAWSLAFLGLGSAILSTADTALNLAAMTISVDLIPSRKADSLSVARRSTLAAAILAAAVSLRLPSILQTLGAASEIMASGLFVPGIAALFLSRPFPRAGACSLIGGGGFALASTLHTFGLPLSLPSWPVSLPVGMAFSLVGFCLGFVLDRFREKQHSSGSERL